ncbi:MAG: flagellar basal body P-ring protein FlgI, partial [Armatimonadota bacterium]
MRWQVCAALTILLFGSTQAQTQMPNPQASTPQTSNPQSQVPNPQSTTSSPVPRPSSSVVEVRLKDIATVHWGVEVPLVGYGLVVGLDGT